MAMAVMPALMTTMVRMFLVEPSTQDNWNPYKWSLLDFRISNLVYFVKIRILPGEEFDDLDAGKKLLEKFGTLIGKNHGFLAKTKHEAHEPDLDRHHDDKDSETSQSTRAQVDQEDD